MEGVAQKAREPGLGEGEGGTLYRKGQGGEGRGRELTTLASVLPLFLPTDLPP